MRYASVCDGIGAVHVAWKLLGWQCAWTAEIEPFPAAVVEHRFGYPNLGDILAITEDQLEKHGPIDLLVGGTPCQSFSVAGLRRGLDDPRGNLALRFLQLAGITRPRWVVWENVHGVLSSWTDEAGSSGADRWQSNDFDTFTRGLSMLSYGWFMRSMDAQYFHLAQRRERVFVVGYLGDWRRAAAVLLERQSLSDYPAPRRETGQGIAGTIAARTQGGGGLGTDFDLDGGLVAGTLNPGVPTLDKSKIAAVAFQTRIARNGRGQPKEIADTLTSCEGGTHADSRPHIAGAFGVRGLTPRECERLQGFPDDYTLIPFKGKPAADTLRYKALGNSMAVPVMRWIGKRIARVEQIAVTPPRP